MQNWKKTKKVDYDRIGERMCAEMLYVNYAGNGVDKYVSLVTKAAATGKVLVLGCEDAEAAKAALEVMQSRQTDPEWCKCIQL